MSTPLYHEEKRLVKRVLDSADPKSMVVEEEITVNVCDDCGEIRYCGDWPVCPHGSGKSFGEQPLEPYFDEHITEKGAWITTRGQRAQIMRENNLEYRKKRTDLLPSGRVYVFQGGKG